MTDEDETVLVILSPLEDDHLPECVEHDATCGHRCWIGPSMKAFIEKRDAAELETTTKCMPCAGGVERIRQAGRDGDLRTAPGVQEEVGVALNDRLRAEIMFRLLGVKDYQ